ncbi:MAG: ABC transporter substrate-binding protein [Propionibacteriaceae bacterium]
MTRDSRVQRGALSVIGLGLAVAMAVSGCSSSTTGGTTTPTPKVGGNLVVGITTDPDNLFPWKATQFQAVNVLQTLYGTLTEFDKDLNVVPGLAESWSYSSDSLSVTMKLRQGVKFADGSTFGSEDVKFSLDKIKDKTTAAVAAASVASVASVEATDANTVTLKLSAPDAALLANLAVINMAMLSSDATEEKLKTTPNGTGPFILKERKPSQSITLARNAAYWGDKTPLDSVEFRIIPDETSIVSAMQSNNIQLAVLNDPLVAKTAQGGSLKVTKTPQLSYHVLQLNARRDVLSDVNVRLAMQCAIDRKQVLDTAALGEGEVTGPITSPAYKSDPTKRPCPTRDLAKAADYLAKAGKSGGVTIKTIVSQGEYATSVAEAQNLKAQLADAKITLDIEVLASNAYVDRWIAGTFDAAVALNGGRPDPDGMYGRYFTSTGNLNKVAGYSSSELDGLFAQGRQSSDPSVRKATYSKIGENLEANAPWIWLFTGFTYTAASSKVSGYVPMANASVQYLRSTSLA